LACCGPEPTAIADADVLTVAVHFGGKNGDRRRDRDPAPAAGAHALAGRAFSAHRELLEEACNIRSAARSILPSYVGLEGDS
jgi:hypothetical protein